MRICMWLDGNLHDLFVFNTGIVLNRFLDFDFPFGWGEGWINNISRSRCNYFFGSFLVKLSKQSEKSDDQSGCVFPIMSKDLEPSPLSCTNKDWMDFFNMKCLCIEGKFSGQPVTIVIVACFMHRLWPIVSLISTSTMVLSYRDIAIWIIIGLVDHNFADCSRIVMASMVVLYVVMVVND